MQYESEYSQQAEEIREQAREMQRTARYMLQDADHLEALALLQYHGIDWRLAMVILEENGFISCSDIRRRKPAKCS